MNAWRVFCLVGLGGLIQSALSAEHDNCGIWLTILLVAVTGWFWSASLGAAGLAARRLIHLLAGRPLPLPATDPKALAAEIASLNAQIAQLRETATSFDMSFDQTLARMDERLRCVEQQSSYVNVTRR